ncbi:DEAD/DEAH box helicase family protein [Leptotrichia massiliensis]|uniref:DEAD/DEAH box helicase n=1 Tax=Leptotrichia massiliensis TaxID=1852388 RepID=UPI0028EFA709|nr:DEAD/DEAH box helicase family protein [Leptotrichia massiliensis]
MIDFKKKMNKNSIQKKINPIDIYNDLDRKSDTSSLRPTQEKILTQWFTENKRDTIIKLHTGEGKTLIGLLMLQSILNENKGPCLYICPNKYLVSQVCAEAKKFGFSYCTFDDGDIPDDFENGKKIMITHAHKVFNGLSKFGINNKSMKIGAIVLDDSHTCIDIIKEAVTITIDKEKNKELYKDIVSIFEEDLKDQGEGSFSDIISDDNDYETIMEVPYWSWMDKKTEILNLIQKQKKETIEIKSKWNLLKNNIINCTCYITSKKIEIVPYFIDKDMFSIFSKAKRRILMSATTQDDLFLIKGLGFPIKAIKNPLINNTQKWSGEKIIIIPSLIHEELDRTTIVSKFSNVQIEKFNFGVVVLVPNSKKAQEYNIHNKAVITDSEKIFGQIDNFKKQNYNKILVINNRYDGIDLPDEMCRILIIDSLPYSDNLSDRYEVMCRPSSEIINKKIAQKIEQGLGRGVRGEKDYCAIIVIGPDLVKFMRSQNSKKYFSKQTQKQIDIGLSINRDDEEKSIENPIEIVSNLLKQILKDRDEGWKEYYNSEMEKIENSDNQDLKLYEKFELEQFIEEKLVNGEYGLACEKLQNYIEKLKNNNGNTLEIGWYYQKLARLYYYQNKIIISNDFQKEAFKRNKQLLKPKSGIDYNKIFYIEEKRLSRIKEFFKKYKNKEERKLDIDLIISDLSFGVKADKFEEALDKVGKLLGFETQRPDKEIRKAPDNLWGVGKQTYLMFECKSEVKDTRKEIYKKEAGQMNSHCGWFEKEYDEDTKVYRFMIIPTKNLAYEADFTHDVKIIRKNKLIEFKKNLKKFIDNLYDYDINEISDSTLQTLLNKYKLNAEDFDNEYSEKFYHNLK